MTDKQTQLKTQPIRQIPSVAQLMVNDHVRDRLKAIATKQLGADKYLQLAIEALRKNPKLNEADPMSFLNAMLQTCALGLEPNTPLGHAYFIPFKEEVTLVIGYKGYADMARRHPAVLNIHADVVYDDDELWSYQYGTDQHLRHKPGPREGNKTHAYCYVKLVDGEAFVVLPWKKVLETRDGSQGWQAAVKYNKTGKSPWKTHEDRMGAKTALRALANAGEMPLAVEFSNLLLLDDKSPASALNADKPEEFDPLAFDAQTGGGGSTIDGTAEEVVEEDQASEQDSSQKPEQKGQADKKAAAPKKTRKAAPKPAEKKPAAEDPPGDDEYEYLAQKIIDNVADAPTVESAVQFHDLDLQRLEAMRPDLHARVMEEIEAARQEEE